MAEAGKDIWDKLQAVGSLLSGIAIPVVLFVVAQKAEQLQQVSEQSARDRELAQSELSVRVAQANIIPPLIDGLLSPEPGRRKLAISAILIALPDDGPKLVRELGTQTEDSDIKSYAASALKGRKEQLVDDLYASDANTRKAAAQSLVSGWQNDSELPQRLIERADANKDNQNGVYNSVVVLSGLSQPALAAHKTSVETFLDKASTQGSKTAQQAQVVKSKLATGTKPEITPKY